MHHRGRSTSIWIIATALAGAACSGRDASGPIMTPVAYCSSVAPIAIRVTVRDSLSGRALADSAAGTVQSGATTDTLVREDSLTLFGGRQVGMYDVSIHRPGYRGWTRAGVAATQTGACGNVVTVPLAARLQALP